MIFSFRLIRILALCSLFYQASAQAIVSDTILHFCSTTSQKGLSLIHKAHEGLSPYYRKIGASVAGLTTLVGIGYLADKCIGSDNLKQAGKVFAGGAIIGSIVYAKSMYNQHQLIKSTRGLLTKSVSPQKAEEFRFFNAFILNRWLTGSDIHDEQEKVKKTIIAHMHSPSIIVYDNEGKQIPSHQVDSTKLKKAIEREIEEVKQILYSLAQYTNVSEYILIFLNDYLKAIEITGEIKNEREVLQTLEGLSYCEQIIRFAPYLNNQPSKIVTGIMKEARKNALSDANSKRLMSVCRPFHKEMTELYCELYTKYLRLLALQHIVNAINMTQLV
jgi:hypothetical protein